MGQVHSTPINVNELTIDRFSYSREIGAKRKLEHPFIDLMATLNSTKKALILSKDKQGSLIGAMLVVISEDKDIWIDRFCVKEEYRGKGIGKAMMQEVENFAFQNNLRLRVSTFDFQAPDFYKRCGYKEDCTIKDYIIFKEFNGRTSIDLIFFSLTPCENYQTIINSNQKIKK
jgi:GNAT superfamily N-acetyltransferase